MQPFYTIRGVSRAPFFYLRRNRHHHPLNPLNPDRQRRSSAPYSTSSMLPMR